MAKVKGRFNFGFTKASAASSPGAESDDDNPWSSEEEVEDEAVHTSKTLGDVALEEFRLMFGYDPGELGHPIVKENYGDHG